MAKFFLILFLIASPLLAADRTNPDLSFLILGAARYSNLGNDPLAPNPNGLHLQEAEIRATSAIDPYFRGDAIFSLEKTNTGYEFNPEEVFIETLAIPQVIVRAGKFLIFLDRHNNLHSHSFPFVDAPLPNQMILGSEGLNGTGLSAAFLIPTPWYFEITPQIFSTQNSGLFDSITQDDVVSVLFVKNLWDISESSTLEVDVAYGAGRNQWDGTTQLTSLGVSYKWRPIVQSIYQSLIVTAQYLKAHRENFSGDPLQQGVSLWFQWQWARRWWLQSRIESVGSSLDLNNTNKTQKNSWLLAFVPSEYSSLRLQYDHIRAPSTETEHVWTLQFNVSMGMHPAHNY